MPTSVLLVDSLPSRASILKRALLDYGYIVVDHLPDSNKLSEKVARFLPDFLVVGIDTPDLVTLEQLARINNTNARPVIMFAEQCAPAIVKQAVKSGVSAYIVDDIQPQRLPSIITVAVARFQEHQSLRKKLAQTETRLAQRKTLERAKGLLMQQQKISEDQAYQLIRKIAMNKGKTLFAVAESIIDVIDVCS